MDTRRTRTRADRIQSVSLGAWVVIASVTMLFTGLSSAYIVRAASAPDWQPFNDAARVVDQHSPALREQSDV